MCVFKSRALSELSDAVSSSDVIIIGAGFFGSVIADVASREFGLTSTIIESRSHIGGNAYSYAEPSTGIEVHKYGSHLFHTSNERVISWVSSFVELNDYVHRVFTTHKNQVFSMPVNLHTMSQFFGSSLNPASARELIESKRTRLSGRAQNLYEKGISSIGPELFEAFFGGYTAKQWQQDPRDLPAEVISRLPVRFSFDSRYFSESFQGVPVGGYGEWFERILDNPQISTFLDLDFFDVRRLITDSGKTVVYSGPIDRYFDYSEGRLGWRTVDFEWETLESTNDYQGCSVMNFADRDVAHTRIHEFRHLHPEADYGEGTVIAREYSRQAQNSDEPYYPINTNDDRQMLARYRERAANEDRVVFGGRLGSYQYLDMHMAIASALNTLETEVVPLVKQT